MSTLQPLIAVAAPAPSPTGPPAASAAHGDEFAAVADRVARAAARHERSSDAGRPRTDRADEATTEEAPTEEAPTEQAVTEQAPTEQAVTEQAATGDAATGDAATGDVATDEAATDEAATEEHVGSAEELAAAVATGRDAVRAEAVPARDVAAATEPAPVDGAPSSELDDAGRTADGSALAAVATTGPSGAAEVPNGHTQADAAPPATAAPHAAPDAAPDGVPRTPPREAAEAAPVEAEAAPQVAGGQGPDPARAEPPEPTTALTRPEAEPTPPAPPADGTTGAPPSPAASTGAARAPAPTAATAAPAAADTTVVAAPADGEPWEQLATVVRPLRQAPDGTHRLSLQLRPAELGTVHLEVAVTDGRLSMRAVADNPMSRDLITAALPELRADLSSSGIDLGSLDVSDHTGPGDGGPTGQRGDAAPVAGTRRGSRAVLAPPPSTPPDPRAATRTAAGQLDLVL